MNVLNGTNGYVADIINDPMVNKVLFSNGFNLLEYIQRANAIQFQSIGIKPISKQSSNNIYLLIALYVQKALDYETVIKNGALIINEYAEWFIKYYPELLPKANDLLSMVKEIGYDSPEKAAEVLQNAIQILQLQDFLKVDYFNEI